MNQNIPSQQQFLDINEARVVYGGSVAWWRKVVFRREIASYRRGDRVAFRREDVESYFAARRVPAMSEAGESPARA